MDFASSKEWQQVGAAGQKAGTEGQKAEAEG